MAESSATSRRIVAGRAPVALLGAALVAVACTAVGARPFFPPLPDALGDTLRAEPDRVISAIAALVVGEGLTVHVSSPAEGYLESDWYDIVARRTTNGTNPDPRREVRLRFFADLIDQGLTQVKAEAVMRRVVDPSVTSRENEVMAPPGSPGDELLRRIFAALELEIGSTER